MIFNFIMESVQAVLDFVVFPILELFNLDLTMVEEYAVIGFDLIVDGWKFINIFIPYMDICLGMALLCISIEAVYKLYLLVMWIIKKIPVLGVS